MENQPRHTMKTPNPRILLSLSRISRQWCPELLLVLIFSSGLFVSAAPGDISTVAGNGSGAFSGDDGPAVSASIRYPQAIALDTMGNIFITDLVNQRIRRSDVVTGIITTIAGTGSSNYNGDGIPAVIAQLNYPDGFAVAPNPNR